MTSLSTWLQKRRTHSVLPDWITRIDRFASRVGSATPSGHRFDRLMRRLSSTANRGVLWVLLATAMMIVGGRRERRGAIRGLVSMAVAAILANLVGKVLVGGPRPLIDAVPHRRRLRKTPTSPSFPSGHSANAAAFVTGVALESPAAAVAYAPLAALVAYSRLHVGAHWLSDVAGGLTLGTAVALAGAPILRRHDPPAGPPIDLPASDDGDGLVLVVNPGSGSGALRRENPADLFLARFPKTRVIELSPAVSRADIVAAAHHDGIRMLGVSGGDGTVGLVAGVALELGLPLVIVPGGTLNHFARTAGVTSVDRTIEALTTGQGVEVDIARVGGGDRTRTVLNTFSIGVYPDMVAAREKLEKRIGKWPAAVVAAFQTLRTAEPTELVVDGERCRVWSLFIGVNRYQPQTLLPLHRESLDDGVLDIRLFDALGRQPKLRLLSSILLGRQLGGVLLKVPAMRRFLGLDFREATSVRIATHGVDVAWDGEVAQDVEELRLAIREAQLAVYAPSRKRRPRR